MKKLVLIVGLILMMSVMVSADHHGADSIGEGVGELGVEETVCCKTTAMDSADATPSYALAQKSECETCTEESEELVQCTTGALKEIVDNDYCENEDEVEEKEKEICCKIYGLGAMMAEVNVKYSLIAESECAIPDGFVGGGRDVVEMNKCVEENSDTSTEALPPTPTLISTDDESAKQVRKQENVKTGENVAFELKNTQKETKVEDVKVSEIIFEDGKVSANGQEIPPVEGKKAAVTLTINEKAIEVMTDDSEFVFVSEGNVKVRTRNQVTVNKEGVMFETKSGKQKLLVLPEQAAEKVMMALGEKVVDLELSETKEGFAYEATVKKKLKLFGFIPMKAKYKVQVDAETGESTVKKPWLSKISAEPKE